MIVTARNMQEYFREILETALQRVPTHLTDVAQAYVVYLLTEFSRSERVFAGSEQGEKPALALLMARASDSQPEEAIRIYKYVGDSSLYFLGYFNESMQRELASPSYYQAMGEQGYSFVATLSRESIGRSSALYGELSERFADLVALLHRMRLYSDLETQGAPTDQKLMDWVDQYQKTKDPELLQKLKSHGVELNVEAKAPVQ